MTAATAARGQPPVKGAPAMAIVAAIFAVSAVTRAVDPASALAVEASSLAGLGAAPKEEHASLSTPSIDGVDQGTMATLLALLRERQEQLDAREERLAERSRIVEAAEARLRAKLAELEATEKRLSDLLEIADGAADRDVGKLVAAFQAMNEKRAGPIFENMDVGFAAGLISRMENGAAADILGALSPEKAYAITVRIAGRNASAPTE